MGKRATSCVKLLAVVCGTAPASGNCDFPGCRFSRDSPNLAAVFSKSKSHSILQPVPLKSNLPRVPQEASKLGVEHLRHSQHPLPLGTSDIIPYSPPFLSPPTKAPHFFFTGHKRSCSNHPYGCALDASFCFAFQPTSTRGTPKLRPSPKAPQGASISRAA